MVYRAHTDDAKTWNLNFKIFQASKVMQSGLVLVESHGNQPNGCHIFDPCTPKPVWRPHSGQTRCGSLSTPADPLTTLSKCIRTSDLFDNHSNTRSWKVIENRHKWSWKMHKRSLSHGKLFSSVCMHPGYMQN